jgi:hypothetical protein
LIGGAPPTFRGLLRQILTNDPVDYRVLHARRCAQGLACLALAAFLMGRLLWADWWIADDHEIALFLGPEKSLGLLAIPRMLVEKTEVGQWGTFLRFRPGYYLIRLLETWAWGDHPGMWFGFRIFLFSITIFGLWRLFSSLLPWWIALFFLWAALAEHFWLNIFVRLGPSEIYCAAGATAFFLGFARLFRNTRRGEVLPWLGILVGSFMAMGSKENFLFLLVPLGALYWDLLSRPAAEPVEWIGWLVTTLSSLYGLLVAGFVLRGIISAGHDVYSNPISISTRSVFAFGMVAHQYLLCFSFVAGCTLYFVTRNRTYLAGHTLLLALFLSQAFFYGEGWPNGSRYDFPGLLVKYGSFALLLHQIPEAFSVLFDRYLGRFRRSRIKSGVSLLSILVAAALLPKISDPFARATAAYVRRSQAFSSSMRQMAEVARHSSLPVIYFVSYRNVHDFERLVSLQRFFYANGVTQPTALVFPNFTGYLPPGDSRQWIADKLLALQEKGAALREIPNSFVPLKQVENQPAGACLAVLFFSSRPWGGCTTLGIMHY